jgi:hypothetical protein
MHGSMDRCILALDYQTGGRAGTWLYAAPSRAAVSCEASRVTSDHLGAAAAAVLSTQGGRPAAVTGLSLAFNRASTFILVSEFLCDAWTGAG